MGVRDKNGRNNQCVCVCVCVGVCVREREREMKEEDIERIY